MGATTRCDHFVPYLDAVFALCSNVSQPHTCRRDALQYALTWSLLANSSDTRICKEVRYSTNTAMSMGSYVPTQCNKGYHTNGSSTWQTAPDVAFVSPTVPG